MRIQMRIARQIAAPLSAIVLAAGCASDAASQRTSASDRKQPAAPIAPARPADPQPVRAPAPQPRVLASQSQSAFRRENDPRYSRLLSYKEKITSQTDLIADGWNFRDPFYGKIGVAGVFKKGGKAMILMGMAVMDASKDDGLRAGLEWVFKEKMSSSLREVLEAETVKDPPANSTLVLCTLELSDGVVQKISFCNPIPWSEIAPKQTPWLRRD
jgi:hypothetical protein